MALVPLVAFGAAAGIIQAISENDSRKQEVSARERAAKLVVQREKQQQDHEQEMKRIELKRRTKELDMEKERQEKEHQLQVQKQRQDHERQMELETKRMEAGEHIRMKELEIIKEKEKQEYKLQQQKQRQEHERQMETMRIELEMKKLEMLMQDPELSDTLMKHTAMTYEHTERMTQIKSDGKQNEDDKDDTEQDDANHSSDYSALVKATGGN